MVRTAKPMPLMMMTSIEFYGWVVLAVSLGLCIVSELDVDVGMMWVQTIWQLL